MALITCKDCGKKISSNAECCPNCGNPIKSKNVGRYCSNCNTSVTPVVTSVGGGSCSFGKRETWKCPQCTKVLHRSGCFVATVVYGDEDFIEVKFLRAFRDEILSKLIIGKIFIWIYYRVGPYAAKIVETFQPLKKISRYILDYIVKNIELFTHLKRSSFRHYNDK